LLDKRLEKSSSHFRQAALMKLQFRSDECTERPDTTLSEVLTEASLLSFKVPDKDLMLTISPRCRAKPAARLRYSQRVNGFPFVFHRTVDFRRASTQFFGDCCG